MTRQSLYLLAAAAMTLATALPVAPASAYSQRDTDACVNKTNSFSKDEQTKMFSRNAERLFRV